MRCSSFVVAAACTAALIWSLPLSSAAHEQPTGGGFVIEGPFDSVASTVCAGGFAGTFPCSNVDLLAYIPHGMMGGTNGNDIWGWTDPLTGHEYALVGEKNGTAFVDVTTPTAPVYVGFLPTHNFDSTWRDVRTFGNYAFIVSEAFSHGMQVFDLRNLRNVASPPATFTETTHYAQFGNCHNLAINEESGYAYAVGTNQCSGGLHMVNINNPATPTFAGCYSADGYTHDTQCVIYHGPDVAHDGKEICFNSNEDTLTIVDVSNKSAPVQLSRTGYQGYGYVHQGWITEDQRYFLADDELDEINQHHNSYTYVWDVTNLDAPVMEGFHEGATAAIDHDQYIRGDFVYQADYRAGLRVLYLGDLSTAELTEVGYFDIYPPDNNPLFNAAWSVYPYFASGTVIVNGIEQGLFVLRPNVGTPVPTATPTATPASTQTRTPTSTTTSTPTRTPTSTPTPTPTRTDTPMNTLTPTRSFSPTLTPTRTSTHTPTAPGGLSGTIMYLGGVAPVEGADVDLQGQGSLSQPTNATGDFAFLGLVENTWQLRPAMSGGSGDAIGSSDALYALEAAVGKHTLGTEQRVACDVTGNGTVGGLDASLILQYAVQLISEVPAAVQCGSEWIFFPHPIGGPGQVTQPQVTESSCTSASIAYDPLTGVAAQQNFTGVLLGDCNASWSGSGSAAAGLGSNPTRLRLGTPRLGRGSMVEVPLYADGDALRAADVVVRYDSRYLHAADVRTLHAAHGAMVRHNVQQPGLVRIALARLLSIDADGKPLLLLRFKVDGRKRTVAIRRAERITITRQHVD